MKKSVAIFLSLMVAASVAAMGCGSSNSAGKQADGKATQVKSLVEGKKFVGKFVVDAKADLSDPLIVNRMPQLPKDKAAGTGQKIVEVYTEHDHANDKIKKNPNYISGTIDYIAYVVPAGEKVTWKYHLEGAIKGAIGLKSLEAVKYDNTTGKVVQQIKEFPQKKNREILNYKPMALQQIHTITGPHF